MTIDSLIEILRKDKGLRAVTRITDAKNVIRVCRKIYKRTGKGAGYGREEFVITTGRPNYLTLAFIKDCKKNNIALSAVLHYQQNGSKPVTKRLKRGSLNG